MAPTGAEKRRRFAETLILGVIAAVILRTWLLWGLVVPLRVTGPSMADTLLGQHYHMPCVACGFPFSWQADRGAPPRWATCPNCGFTENDSSHLKPASGDRIFVVPCIFSARPPRRWELVVLRQPGSEAELAVKRVVGLPGETIELSQGDLYVDGHLQRKTLADQRRTAVLVHDTRYLALKAADCEQPWRAERETTDWQLASGCYSFPASTTSSPKSPPSPNLLESRAGNAADGIDWLVFSLRRQLPGGSAKPYVVPITNLRGYNQGRQQRVSTVFPVTDVLLSVELERTSGVGCLFLAATDGRDEYCVEIEPSLSRATIFRNGDEIASAVALPASGGRLKATRIEFSLIDRQLLLALNGLTTAAIPLPEAAGEPAGVVRPLAIGTNGLGVRLSRIRVFRDIYYTAVEGGEGPASNSSWHLGSDQFFVLGDNSVYSRDSRTWHHVAQISHNLLIGKPFSVGR